MKIGVLSATHEQGEWIQILIYNQCRGLDSEVILKPLESTN